MALDSIGGADVVFPDQRGLYYGGEWHDGSETQETHSPSTGQSLGRVAWANAQDVDQVVRAAQAGFRVWRAVKPLERGRILREAAAIIRANGRELALIDAADCGNPVAEMVRDAEIAAASLDYFAGLVLELKGDTIPMGDGTLNYTIREPLGVVVRINAYNHPFMFAAMRAGAPLGAGNSLIIKPPEQAPLSSLRLAELIGPLFPAGVFNVVAGGRACGEALVAHPGVAKVGLIGSVPTGRAILRGAAETMKKVGLELGGKNALIAYPGCRPGSRGGRRGARDEFHLVRPELRQHLPRLPAREPARCRARCRSRDSRSSAIRPGLPTRFESQMGCLVSRAQYDKVLRYVAWGQQDGARLVCGGVPPEGSRTRRRLVHRACGVFAERDARRCASRARRFSGRSCRCSAGPTRQTCSAPSTTSSTA